MSRELCVHDFTPKLFINEIMMAITIWNVKMKNYHQFNNVPWNLSRGTTT